jgi:hypothetical protein
MKHARNDYNRIQDPENKIPENEPVFLLRGQDIFAPAVLLFYAEQLSKYNAEQFIKKESNNEMVRLVTEQAFEMLKWQKEQKAKEPDL